MRPTRIAWLVAVAVISGAAVYAAVELAYSSIPPVPLYAPVAILFLGIAELLTAGSVRSRLDGRPGTRPIAPMAAARLAALAKASALAAAVAFGGYAGLLGYTLRQLDKSVPAHDATASGFGVLAALVLVLAALALERTCRLPDGDDDDPDKLSDRDWDPLAHWHDDGNGGPASRQGRR